MNETIKNLLNHRTIRAWKEDPIPEEIMQTLFEVANRTSTSNGMQSASIIRVKDPALLEKIKDVSTQGYLATAPEFLIFLVDTYRNTKIIDERNNQLENKKPNYGHDPDRFFQGWTDACLMAQSIAIAAESLGLGIVYFGSILNDQAKMIELLDLPKYTYPVVGLGLGYPDQEPQLKPRMSVDKKVFVDTYQSFDNYHDTLSEYDKEMQTYYDLRDANRRVDSFTQQVFDKNTVKVAKRSETFKLIEEQGFDFE